MDDPLSPPTSPLLRSVGATLELSPLPDGGRSQSPSASPLLSPATSLDSSDSSDAGSRGRWGKQKESGADGPGSQRDAAELGEGSETEEERERPRRRIPTAEQ